MRRTVSFEPSFGWVAPGKGVVHFHIKQAIDLENDFSISPFNGGRLRKKTTPFPGRATQVEDDVRLRGLVVGLCSANCSLFAIV